MLRVGGCKSDRCGVCCLSQMELSGEFSLLFHLAVSVLVESQLPVTANLDCLFALRGETDRA